MQACFSLFSVLWYKYNHIVMMVIIIWLYLYRGEKISAMLELSHVLYTNLIILEL